jgi:glutathione S-transferase
MFSSINVRPMPLLYHHPFCPHSRFIRLIAGELSMEIDCIEERILERRREFLLLNPAGTLPVLVEHDGISVPGPGTIAEYLDETRGLVLGDRRLLPDDPAQRVEVRRLTDWFNTKFFFEVSEHLLIEKIYKRFLPPDLGGGAPDPGPIRAASINIRYHLQYLAHLLQDRNWLAGNQMSYADLAAAAHLSTLDYLGDVPWDNTENTRHWYARVKSRPSFRPLLQDRLAGMPPVRHYADLDF